MSRQCRTSGIRLSGCYIQREFVAIDITFSLFVHDGKCPRIDGKFCLDTLSRLHPHAPESAQAVVDPKKERICVQEAHTLGIPLIGICDTNCDPEELDYVIPGNDDAIRAVKLIVSKMADAVIEANQGATGEEEFVEEAVEEAVEE